MENSVHLGIDKLDLRLLDILQRHGALSVAEVASRVRISTSNSNATA
jgi:DNA-binding Lrp family transcriptional regulator